MSAERACLVCGYDMREGPRDFNICPSCGTEFGYEDANRTHKELRDLWIANGMRWWSPVEPAPDGWNPEEQLRRIPQPKKAVG